MIKYDYATNIYCQHEGKMKNGKEYIFLKGISFWELEFRFFLPGNYSHLRLLSIAARILTGWLIVADVDRYIAQFPARGHLYFGWAQYGGDGDPGN